jgi:hypothetical protein
MTKKVYPEELHDSIFLSHGNEAYIVKQLRSANFCEWPPNWHRLETWIQHELERHRIAWINSAIARLQNLREDEQHDLVSPLRRCTCGCYGFHTIDREDGRIDRRCVQCAKLQPLES